MSAWGYLAEEPFAGRYALAAWWLRECAGAIEIGAGPNALSDHIHGRPCLCVGPGVGPARHPEAEHASVVLQDGMGLVEAWAAAHPGFGLVLLGLELRGLSDGDWERLCALARQARRLVIECAVWHEPSAQQAARLRAGVGGRTLAHWRTFVANGTEAGCPAAFCQRELWVMAPEG